VRFHHSLVSDILSLGTSYQMLCGNNNGLVWCVKKTRKKYHHPPKNHTRLYRYGTQGFSHLIIKNFGEIIKFRCLNSGEWLDYNCICDICIMSCQEPERRIDNVHLFKAISDYAAVIYDGAIGLQTSLLNMGELCLVMKDLQEPLKHVYAYSNNKVSADVELQRLLQKLFVALQNMKTFVIDRAQIQYSSGLLEVEKECAPYIKRLEEAITALVVYLRRIGIYNRMSQGDSLSPWVYKRPAHETMTTSLWPMIFLPDRNLVHISRHEVLKKLSDIITPNNKPQHVCVVNKNGAGAMGRSETMLETAYQSLEKGIFGVIVWIPCHSEASISSSFHYLAERIVQNDPSFAPSGSALGNTAGDGNAFSSLTKSSVIDLVVRWMEKLPMPYMLVFDNADDPSFLPPAAFPRAGQGTVVLLTLALHISSWRSTIRSRPKVVELSHLDAEEGMQMAEQSLCTVVKTPKIDSIDLMKYFDYSPVHFCCALNAINFMRNRSFVEIGPRDFLDRISRDVPTLLGHSIAQGPGRDQGANAMAMATGSGALQQVIASYKSVMIRLHCAADFAHASRKTIQRIMDLVCFVCTDGVDLRMFYDWIKPSYCPLSIPMHGDAMTATLSEPTGRQQMSPTVMKIGITFNKSILGDRSIHGSEDTEFIVSISSLFPRRLKTSGEYSYEWVVYRRHADLEYFFNYVKVKCSPKLHQLQIPPLQPNALLKQQTNKLNELFTEMCCDAKWALLCDDDLVKKFLNIHTADCSESQVTEKMMGLMQPLVALGLLRVQHRLSGLKLAAHGDSMSLEDGDLSGHIRRTLVTLGTHSSVQDAVLYGLRGEQRDEDVAKEVIRFLIGYFRNLEIVESAPSEDTWMEEGISREALLPHVERAVTMTSSDLGVCLELCSAAYRFAVERQIFNTAHVLATRALDILVTLSPSNSPNTPEISCWKFNIAHCSLKRMKYAEASLRYAEALESYQCTSTHPDTDPHIATIYSELAETCQLQGNYAVAELHLNSMRAIWQRSLEAEPSNVSNEKYVLEDVAYNRRMSVVKDLQADISSALTYSQKTIDAISVLSKGKGSYYVEVAEAMRTRALLLMNSEKFDDAKSILRDALKLFERVENSLLHKNVPALYMTLAQCYLAQAKYSSAEDMLHHALDIVDKLGAEPTILEMKAEVLATLSEVLMEQGKHDNSVKCAEESHDIWKKLYGDSNEKTALALCSTGKLLKTLARYVDAEAIFNEVLVIGDKCLRSQATIEALNQLAEMASAQSKYLEAESYVSRALTCLREAQYDGQDRESTGVIANQLCALAELKKEQHEFEKTRECYEEALQMLRSVYGSQHALVAHVLELLADLFSDRGEERSARIHREESIRIYRQLGQGGVPGRESSPLGVDGEVQEDAGTASGADGNVTVSASALGSLAALLSADDKFEEAAPMLEKVFIHDISEIQQNTDSVVL
jgi:tetratricopeptide (TPR) repeat protein